MEAGLPAAIGYGESRLSSNHILGPVALNRLEGDSAPISPES